MNRLLQLPGNFIEQFLDLFLNLLIGTKFTFAHKNLTHLFVHITVDFRLLLKKILVSRCRFHSGSFNFRFINILKREISLLVKRTSMEWETMSTPDLIWQTSFLVLWMKERSSKFLTLKSIKWRLLKQIRTLLVSALTAKSKDIGKEIITKVISLGIFSLSKVLSVLYDVTPSNYEALPNLSFKSAWRTFSQIGSESLSFLTDIRSMVSGLNPTTSDSEY